MSAIKSLADGFAERSRVEVTLELPQELDRLAPHVEISIFRIVQECLTNVYRHSGSKTVSIRVILSDHKTLIVQVTDQGKGIAPGSRFFTASETGHGVGLSGMRERARELGGTLGVQSNENGTTVTAEFPVNAAVTVEA